MTVWSWIRLTVCLWLLRKAFKAAGWLLLFALAVAVWPLTVLVIFGYAAGWLRGWPPVRMYRAAAASLPMTAVYLLGEALRTRRWQGVALAPVRDWARGWDHGWHHLSAGLAARTFLLLVPVTVPAGLALAGLVWAWRIYAITSGIGGRLASAPITFDARQWKRQARAAEGRVGAPGAVPLLGRGARIPVGGTIRAIGHRWRPVFSVPFAACARHMVIIGATGCGKTNLMIRLWAGWYTAARNQEAAGGRRPLLIVLDCKGGRDARTKAGRTRRLLHGAGARHVAIWPDEARLSLWDIPAPDLAVLLYQMIDTGQGNAAYYADILQAILTLACTAPAGPPASTAAFLERLDARWLEAAWDDGYHPAETASIRAAARHIPDIALRMSTLLGRLGPALDGPGQLTDADAWYFILEGTREPSVAEAQAMALTELAAHAATSAASSRAILLAADDYSAVSRRVPISNLYERGRSLGIGVQVSAQSWQGLGADDDERYRIAATADGGIWLMHTPYPEPVVELAGTRRVLATAHKLIGAAWGDEGTTREQRTWVADPDLIRRLKVGQACYISHGAATFVQVARPRPSPLTLLPARVPAGPPPRVPAPRREPAPDPLPIDDFFGPGAAP
jgi:hypothetical protein